jgi:hypothetical protein
VARGLRKSLQLRTLLGEVRDPRAERDRRSGELLLQKPEQRFSKVAYPQATAIVPSFEECPPEANKASQYALPEGIGQGG